MSRRDRIRQTLNPYIVLSDVLIATLVLLIVLLFALASQLGSTRQKLLGFEAREDKRLELEKAVDAMNSELKKTIDDSFGKEKDFSVASARGPTSFLIRIYNWKNERIFSDDERIHALIEAVSAHCESYKDAPVAPIVEVRVEGHCQQKERKSVSNQIGRARTQEALLEKSFNRALNVQQMFPVDLRHLVGVSGFGSYRPAYEATAWTVYSQLEDADLKARIRPLVKGDELELPLEMKEREALFRVKKKEKESIEDRVDIIVVYAGLNRDNNFVYPRQVRSDKEPPEWMNDVSWPYIHQRFLDVSAKEQSQ